jgi:hypothetical protein
MSLQCEKTRIIDRINLIEDPALIEMIRSVLDYGLSHQMGRVSTEQYNLELEAADEDISKGNGIRHEGLKNQIKDR